MKRFDVYLGIGSNLGLREEYLRSAARALNDREDSRVVSCSPVYETDPVGKTDQPKFLNAAIHLQTELSPDILFHELKKIEEKLGRRSRERWGSREIDIDILVYDGLVHRDEQLQVPHPEMENRRFVLVPLCDIAPDLVHPVSGLTVQELLSECRINGRVVRSQHTIAL